MRGAVAALALVLVGGYVVLRLTGGDGDVTASSPTPSATGSGTAGAAAGSPPASTPPAPAATPSASGTAPPATASNDAATARPPTLAFTVRYPAYITVRVPGGKTLVSKVFKKGATASYDRKVLEVVNGRPDAVRFVVNGKPRKPGPSGQTETFTVRRR